MKLNQLRFQLDQIDNQLLALLDKRQQVVKKVAHLKKKSQQKIHQPNIETRIINHKLKQARQLNLNPQFIKQLFQLIINESKRLQRSLIK